MVRAQHDAELDELRARVDCRVLLENDGWSLDGRSSTRKSTKYYKHEGKHKRIIIVTHEGRGWFDGQEDAKGDVFALAQYLWRGENFGQVRRRLRPLAGMDPALADVRPSTPSAPIDAGDVWGKARTPRPGSQGWGYLLRERALPGPVIARAVSAGVIREGVYGTIWAAHRDEAGNVIGWEMRGPQYKGFKKDTTKGLFVLGDARGARRVCVAEAFIDALSLGELEGWPEGTAYASTGGGYGPRTAEILAAIIPADARLVAASDNGDGGERLARRLQRLAERLGLSFGRRRPELNDWNADLIALRAS